MAVVDFQISVRDYTAAVAALYASPSNSKAERDGGTIRAAPDLDQKAQAMVDASGALREATTQDLLGADGHRRELAELQLLAAAAVDLHVADDLLRAAGESERPEMAERDASLPNAMADLGAILRADPGRGLDGLLGRSIDRALAPATFDEAKQALREAVDGAVTDIRDAAARAGKAAVASLLAVPAATLQKSAAALGTELLANLSTGLSHLVAKAVDLIAHAIQKLLDVLGKDAQKIVREKASKWVEDLRDGGALGTLLDRLYETERIRQVVSDQIDGTSNVPPAAFNDASHGVAKLAAHFNKQSQTLAWVIHGLGLVRPWVMTVQPWGPIALPSASLLVLGCVVFLGGDYVDWFRTDGWTGLNYVAGVRTVVARSLTPQ